VIIAARIAQAREEGLFLLDTTQAAELLGLRRPTITRYCREGVLDAQQVGQTWVITLDAVAELAERGLPKVGRPAEREEE